MRHFGGGRATLAAAIVLACLVVLSTAGAADPPKPLAEAEVEGTGCRKVLGGLSTRSLAIIPDNFGSIELSDVDERDRVRRLAQRKVLVFANRFVDGFSVAVMKSNLQRMYRGVDVEAIPAKIIDHLSGLEKILDIEASPLNDADKARLEKIKVAFLVDALLSYAAPGKRPLWDEDGPDGSAFANFLATYSGDKSFLERIKAYEDQYDQLYIFRVNGSDGKTMKSRDQLRSEMIVKLKALVDGAGAVNNPSDMELANLVDRVLDEKWKAGTSWTVQDAWYQISHANAATVNEAKSYTMVSGGGLFGVQGEAIAEAIADSEGEPLKDEGMARKVVEAASSIPAFEGEYEGATMWDGRADNGSWQPPADKAITFAFVTGSSPPVGVTSTEKVLLKISIDVKPMPYEIVDQSFVASGFPAPYNETPRYQVSDQLLSIMKLLDVVDEPATNMPSTEPNLSVPEGSSVVGAFSNKGPVGSPF